MNNIFLPNDPLLYNQQPNYKQLYEDRLLCDREQIDKQYKEYLSHMQQQPTYEDKIEQLNVSLKNISPEIKIKLEQHQEFVDLNKELQDTVQNELVALVKNTINSNKSIVTNIDRQIAIINEISNNSKEEERKTMSEINDYIKNYSNMTFDEYKKLKDTTK